MDLELLRQLAALDPELPLTFEERHHGTVINLKRPFNRYLTLPSDQDAINRWCERLFFALLDRIKVRGWQYVLRNHTHMGSDLTLTGPMHAIIYTPQGMGDFAGEVSECEALARAYIAALEAQG